MLRTFIQVTALLAAFISSLFWIRSSLVLTSKDMAALSGTYWDHSLPTLKNLSAQKADSLIAFILIVTSFILQMINLMWPMRFCDFSINRKGVIAAICCSLISSVSLYFAASLLKKYYFAQAEKLLKEEKREK